MNLLCPVCHAPIEYAYETKHCEKCGWRHKTKRYSHIQIPDSDPLWVDSTILPDWFRQGYQRVQTIFTMNSTFLSCALSLCQYIQQLITLPVLIGGSILYDKNPDFSLSLSPSSDLTIWSEALEILLARPELRDHPIVGYILIESQLFIQTAQETAFLPEGLLSGSFEPSKRNMLAMLKRTCQLISTLGHVYQKLNLRAAPSHPTEFVFTIEKNDYPLWGVYKKNDTCFLLTHILNAETAACSAVSGSEYDTMSLPAFCTVQTSTKQPIESFASTPDNAMLIRRIHSALDGDRKKGLLLLRTDTEMGTPAVVSGEENNEQFTILYNAQSRTVNQAAALLETVAAHCAMDASLLSSLKGISSVSLTKLLTFLQNQKKRKILLVIANADAYTDPLFPLHTVLPSTSHLPEGVWIALHSANHKFSLAADRELTLHPGDGSQSAFLFDYLLRHEPARSLELPARRTERLASYVAAARGNFPHIYFLATFEKSRQRPSAKELDTLNRPKEMFLQIAEELYDGYEEALAKVLTFCEMAAAGHTLTDLQRILSTLNPWFIQIVAFDIPLLSRWHIAPIQQKYPIPSTEIISQYLRTPDKGISLRQLANTLYTVAQWGTEAQKSEQQSKPWKKILLDAVSNISPYTDIQALRCFCEAILNVEGIAPVTCPAARALLTLYEETFDFSAWTLAHNLLENDQVDPLTQLAAAVTTASLLANRGDDQQALTVLSRLPELKQSEAIVPEQAMLLFRTHVLYGEIYFRQNKSTEAVAQLEQAFSGLPENALTAPRMAVKAADAHSLCADSYNKQEKHEAALIHYSAAANLYQSLSTEQVAPDTTQKWIDSLMQAATCQLMLEQDTEAIENYSRAEKLIKQDNSEKAISLLATVHSSKAELFERNANTEHALQERVEAIDCLTKLHDTEHMVTLCRTLQKTAQNALNLGRMTLAIRYLKTAVVLLEKLTAAKAVCETEWLRELQRQLNDAQDASDQMNPILTPEQDKETPPETVSEIPVEELLQKIKQANIALQTKQYFAVIDTLLPVMTTLDRLSEPDCLEALQSISLAYIGAQRTEEGMQWLEMLVGRAQAPAEQSTPSDTLAYILSAMGMVYRMHRRDDEALESYSAAIDMWNALSEREETLDQSRFASTCINRSVLLSDRKQYARAIQDLHRAIHLREKTKIIDQSGLARLYLNLGYVYGQSGETERALEYNRKAIELRKRLLELGLVSVAELARSYLNIGIIYGSKKQVKEEVENYGFAIEHLQSVEHLSPEERQLLIKLYRYRAMSYQTLGKIHEQQEDLRRADLLGE